MTQAEALDILKMGHNVYLTGSAGSGKTYLLNKYIQFMKEHDVAIAVTASTGIAASHMNGMTIHSWSGLGIRATLTEYDLEAMEEKRYLWERFQEAKILIIDEISMLHHYRLDLVDRVARFFKRNEEPFGGMQVILCGDFFQLPPVTRRGEPDAHFAYLSDAWKALNLKICYLTESHRQNDADFLSVLNAIRSGTVSGNIKSHLEKRFNVESTLGIRPTKLYTHNADVDVINNQELEKVEGEKRTYTMTDKGRDVIVAALKSSCLAPESLVLKKGAQVMFVKNNYDAGYVNGTLGTVVEVGQNHPIVKTVSGRLIEAKPMDWNIEDDGKVKASINQVPLRLAWAITVHKSQGMTLDAAEIDLSKAFEKGMGYVALSRVKSLEGLNLVGLNTEALHVDEEVLLVDEDFREQSAKTAEALNKLDQKEKETFQQKFLDSIAPKSKKKKEKKIETHLVTRLMILEKKSLTSIAEERSLREETIIDHIEKIIAGGEDLDIEYLKKDIKNEARLKKILDALKVSFLKHGDYRLAPVKNTLGAGFSYYEIRLARLFLNS